MRIGLTTFILTMLVQPLWADEYGTFQPIANDFCKKVMAKGVSLGHVEISNQSSYSRTETRFFYKGEIYLIEVWHFEASDYSGWRCRVLRPRE